MNSLIAMMCDDSSSMFSTENVWATAEGWNTFVRTQQMRMDDCVFYGAFYGTQLKPRQPFVPLAEAEMLYSAFKVVNGKFTARTSEELSANPVTYNPGDGTNMAMSIDQLFTVVAAKIDSLPADKKPVSVTYVIQSDGAERTDNPMFKKACDHIAGALKAGRRVIWLQAGDRALYAKSLGIPANWIVEYHPGVDAVKVFEKASIAILEELVAPGSGKGL